MAEPTERGKRIIARFQQYYGREPLKYSYEQRYAFKKDRELLRKISDTIQREDDDARAERDTLKEALLTTTADLDRVRSRRNELERDRNEWRKHAQGRGVPMTATELGLRKELHSAQHQNKKLEKMLLDHINRTTYPPVFVYPEADGGFTVGAFKTGADKMAKGLDAKIQQTAYVGNLQEDGKRIHLATHDVNSHVNIYIETRTRAGRPWEGDVWQSQISACFTPGDAKRLRDALNEAYPVEPAKGYVTIKGDKSNKAVVFAAGQQDKITVPAQDVPTFVKRIGEAAAFATAPASEVKTF